MKSLTSISQGFGKWTKATLQSSYFWGTPPDDCFCLEKWSRYYYNVKHRKFKTVLIWRNSRKMNRYMNVLILYHLWKKLFKFSNAHKKVFHFFSFQLCSTANSKFSFYVWLGEINCIKIQTISLALNLSILASLFVFYLLWRHHSPATEKKFKLVELFFQSRKWNKNMCSCATIDTGHAQRFYLTVARLSVALWRSAFKH